MAKQLYTDDELIEALERNGGNKAATARDLQFDERTLRRRLKRLALKGYSPEHDMVHTVPDGFKVKGVSTYYNADGQPTGQWVKSSADDERRYQMMLEAVEAMKEEVPRQDAISAPASSAEDLLNCYVITDYHFGQLSWGYETRGEDYDLKIAEQQLVDWFAAAIASSPNSAVGVFAQVGDFLHYSGSGLQATTESSGHILDADGRFQKLVSARSHVRRKSRHKRVSMASGNAVRHV